MKTKLRWNEHKLKPKFDALDVDLNFNVQIANDVQFIPSQSFF